MEVRFASQEVADEYGRLPRSIKIRMDAVLQRLADWPNVSGAKPLRHSLAGHYRIRSGDYRIQFHVRGDAVIIERTGHRDGFYEE
jgi:mRNA-degrading endonuclease RelE of RelBE toxin-antitoxin system